MVRCLLHGGMHDNRTNICLDGFYPSRRKEVSDYMGAGQRPLSPHLQVYRLPLTVVLSITHRITGAALAIGALLLIATLAAAAAGPQAYASMHAFLASWFGQLLLFAWTLAMYFHFCNGIRHLFWDAGYGFELPIVDKTAYAAIAVAVALTVVTWIVALAAGGSA